MNLENMKRVGELRTKNYRFDSFKNGSQGVKFLLGDSDLKLGDITFARDAEFIALASNKWEKLLRVAWCAKRLDASEGTRKALAEAVRELEQEP